MTCTLRRLALAGLVALTLAAPAAAQNITIFNFNDAAIGTDPGTPANTAALFSADFGSGSLSSTFTPTNIVSFTGTTINAQNGNPAGAALALQGGAGNANNGGSLTIQSSTLGFSGIMVSLAIQRTGTGFNSDQFQVSADGLTFTNFGTGFTPAASFAVVSFDLSSITGLNNNANARFRFVFNGATSASGNNRIDNIVVSGTSVVVPEPTSVALMGLGVFTLVGLGFRRRILARAAIV